MGIKRSARRVLGRVEPIVTPFMGVQVVAQKRDYQASEVIAALLYIATNVAVVVWLTAGERLFRSFLLQPPTPPITVRILPDDVRPAVQHRVYPQHLLLTVGWPAL